MYKKQGSFSFIALLFIARLSEHEQSGVIGMLKAGVHVADIIAIRQLYSPSEIVTRLLGQLNIDTGLRAFFHHFGTMTHTPGIGNFSMKMPKIGNF